MRTTFTRAEAVRLTGVPELSITSLHRAGVLPSTGRLCACQLLGIATARGLKDRGLPMVEAGHVLDYFWDMPIERLEHEFARGAHFICVAGDRVLPRLVPRTAIEKSREVAEAVALRPELLPALVDVKIIWDRLQAAAAKLDETAPPPKKATVPEGR